MLPDRAWRKVFIGSNGLRAGWRFLLFIAIGQFMGKSLGWLITRVYHYQERWNPRDFIVDGALSLAIAMFAAWLLFRWRQQSFADFGFPLRKAFGALFWEGVFWGFATSAIVVSIICLARGTEFHGLALAGAAFVKSALMWGLAFLLVGLLEEFLFRGYALVTLAEGMGFWPAALVTSLLFGGEHLLKPKESFLDIFNIILFGLFWCFTLRRTGNLWFAIGFHAMSDYADMVIFAEPNTGNAGQPLDGHLLNVTLHGPAWLTGGIAGTEASVPALAVLLATWVIFALRFRERQALDAIVIPHFARSDP